MLTLETHNDVSVIKWDDGKVNALTYDASQGMLAHLDEVEEASKAVVIQGREGIFSAGFDLKVIQGDDTEATRKMIASGFELCLRMFSYPQPVVLACTGHGMAAGAIMLMSADVRVGAEGDFKLGLNEVAIGLAVPPFLIELARERLSNRHLTQATLLSKMYTPSQAVDAGYLDEVAPPSKVVDVAMERAAMLAETLDRKAFKASRKFLRAGPAEQISASLSGDIASLLR